MPVSLKTNGTPVHIFLDMCTEVSKLWGAFDHLNVKLGWEDRPQPVLSS